MAHPPPVPPASRSDKGPSADAQAAAAEAASPRKPAHADEQARQSNVKQNTTNTGYQQDR